MERFFSPDYSSWVAPEGFTVTVADWATLSSQFGNSVMATTTAKTAHGTIPSSEAAATAGGIVWIGIISIAPDQTSTFGFDHLYPSVDVEWFAEHPDAATSSQGFLTNQIAGPVGTFTNGIVHAPSESPVPVESTTWGRIKALY